MVPETEAMILQSDRHSVELYNLPTELTNDYNRNSVKEKDWERERETEREREREKKEREREREKKERGRERERGQVFQPPSLPLWLCFYLTTVSSSSSPQLALSYFCELFSLCFHFNHFKPFPLSDVLPRSIVSELQTDKCLIRQKKRPGKKDPGSSSFEESFRDF